MPLNLSPADQAEYMRRLAPLEAEKQAARAAGNDAGAKRARQKIDGLYKEFIPRQPPPDPPTPWEIENALTVEQRLDRIEGLLRIGRYSD